MMEIILQELNKIVIFFQQDVQIQVIMMHKVILYVAALRLNQLEGYLKGLNDDKKEKIRI